MAIAPTAFTAVENSGNRKALDLKVYSGEVLTAFDKKNIGLSLVKNRTISSGTSASFVVTGRIEDSAVNTHTAGEDVSTTTMPDNERVILIEDLQYVSTFVDKFEEKMAHFEIRAELSKRAGEALAVKIDKQVFATVVQATKSKGVAGQPDGSSVNNDTIDTGSTAEEKGDAIIDAIFTAKATLDANDVTGDLIFVTSPVNYYNLVQSSKAVNRDFNDGGNGSIAKGVVLEIAGIKVVTSNHFGYGEAYGSKKLQGLMFTMDAVGVVKLLDINSEANYIPEKLGHLMTSSYALGMGVLNPGASVAITGGDA